MSSVLPYHYVNAMSGTKFARLIEDASEYADLIKKANRPLLVVGADSLKLKLDGLPVIGYAVRISKTLDIPVCATAHTSKKLRELGLEPASTLDIIEIINFLKNPEWKGVRGEGNHGLVIFLSIRSDLATQGLSTLKHFARHLKTMTLCKYYYPNASYSLPNFRKDEKWKEFLEALISDLEKKEA
jgi:anaerobic carbon-monoxide dehydrogenase, CODH/ACS complex subunit epsilon